MSSAFNGRADLQASVLARLAAHVDAKRLVPGAFRWTGDQGSLVGCMLESPDQATWETELGLPQWLALLADKLAEGSGSPEKAAAFGARLLQAVRPGADLDALGSHFILQLLDDLKPHLASAPEPVMQAVAGVEQLHRDAAQGQQAPAPQWRAARRAATAATDQAGDEQLRTILACVETAAWSPSTSPVVVYDTLRTWVSARTLLAALDAGWRPDYEPTLRARLQEMFDTYLKDDAELRKTVTVFDLLEKHYPDDAATIRMKNRTDRSAHADAYSHAAELLLSLLQTA